MLSYMYGTRSLRLLFLRKGWIVDRRENIESILDAQTGMRIVFQNVDQACSEFIIPQAVSGKGPAADRLINKDQPSLFSAADLPEAVIPLSARKQNDLVWYFCMSFEGDAVAAELSLPISVSGTNFSGFYERIFIGSGSGWTGSVPRIAGDEPVHELPVVKRKV